MMKYLCVLLHTHASFTQYGKNCLASVFCKRYFHMRRLTSEQGNWLTWCHITLLLMAAFTDMVSQLIMYGRKK